MKLLQYLNQFSSQSLHLIGPFFDEKIILTEPVVFVDSGVQFKKKSVGFSVGDGDSAEFPLDEYLEPKKDFSDLAYVLQQIPAPYQEIYFHGFLGGRKDHELMNLAEVHRFLTTSQVLRKCSLDQSILAFSAGTWSFTTHGLFSLFAFADVKVLLGGDCEYPIQAPQTLQSLSSHGLSNRGSGAMNLVCNGPVFIFLNA